MRAAQQPPLYFYWFCLADTDQQSEQVWNSKHDRLARTHRRTCVFLLARLIMTDVEEVELQPADFWLLDTHQAQGDPGGR